MGAAFQPRRPADIFFAAGNPLPQEIPSKKAHEDEQLLAFHDINPWAPVHVLIVPKEHIATHYDVRPEHDALLGRRLGLAPESLLARMVGAPTEPAAVVHVAPPVSRSWLTSPWLILLLLGLLLLVTVPVALYLWLNSDVENGPVNHTLAEQRRCVPVAKPVAPVIAPVPAPVAALPDGALPALVPADPAVAPVAPAAPGAAPVPMAPIAMRSF